MSNPTHLAMQAETLLANRFTPSGKTSKYISAHRTHNGRELALEKDRKQDIFLWAEYFDVNFIEVAVNNRDFPGQPYHPDQPRNSNLNGSRAPRLMRGNQAYYLKFSTPTSFERFLDWYAEIPA